MSDMASKASEAAEHLSGLIDAKPALGVVLGSGLGSLARRINNPTVIPYTDIPNFPMPSVEGHEGNLVCGRLAGADAAVMQGRFHYYEGYYMRDVTFPVRVLALLGVKVLIVTNASGGINDAIPPGGFMAVKDHINLMGTNPLIGMEDGGGRGFLDLTRAYDTELLGIAQDAALEAGLTLYEGVLAAVQGPCYETPAEVRMLRTLGADAVCMSSVPEVIMARQLGMRVLCISLVTNRAAGLSDTPPTHSEVIEVAEGRHAEFARLIEGIAVRMAGAGVV
jgi:purine-nucleoside phosphorylase